MLVAPVWAVFILLSPVAAWPWSCVGLLFGADGFVASGLVAVAADDAAIVDGVESASGPGCDVVGFSTVGLATVLVVEWCPAVWASGDSVGLACLEDSASPLLVPGGAGS